MTIAILVISLLALVIWLLVLFGGGGPIMTQTILLTTLPALLTIAVLSLLLILGVGCRFDVKEYNAGIHSTTH